MILLKYAQTISYKKQIKDKAIAQKFQSTLAELTTTTNTAVSKWDCFLKLTRLKDVINDEHSRVTAIGIQDTEVEVEESTFYKNLPKIDEDLNLLENRLSKLPQEEVEGIYYGDDFTIAVVKEQSIYKGIVLKATNPLWRPGMQLFELKPAKANNYRIAFISPDFKSMRSLNAERIVEGRFMFFGIAKNHDASYHYAPKDTETYFYKNLSENIDYMRIESFSSAGNNIADALGFIETTFPKITASNLILDLRNNGGGSDRIGKPLRKALKKYARKNNIYVLVNGLSASNAEHTALFLNKIDNVTLLGDRTMGVIAYGLNYGEKIILTNNHFSFYLTDMNFSKFMPYESMGVPVDVTLSTDTDWIDQTEEYFNSGKNI